MLFLLISYLLKLLGARLQDHELLLNGVHLFEGSRQLSPPKALHLFEGFNQGSEFTGSGLAEGGLELQLHLGYLEMSDEVGSCLADLDCCLLGLL